MKDMLKNKGLAFYISAVVFVLALIGLVTYTFANKAASGLVAVTYIVGIVALIATAASMFFDYKGIVSIIVPALLVATAVLAFVDNATAFALALNGVAQGESDMGGPNTAFWICMVSLLVAGFAASVGCFFNQSKIEKTK